MDYITPAQNLLIENGVKPLFIIPPKLKSKLPVLPKRPLDEIKLYLSQNPNLSNART